MAFACSCRMVLLGLIIPLLAASFVQANVPSITMDSPVSAGVRNVCKTTPDPSFCKSALPDNGTADVYFYGRYSVKKSVSQARRFLSLVDRYLARASTTLTASAVGALQDCRLLASLNLDFLLSSFQALNNNATALPAPRADDVQTLLSAILTNQESCMDGLRSTASAWTVKDGLSQPLANNTKLYSVSLALFTKAWVPSKSKKQHKLSMSVTANGKLSLSMSSTTQAVFELASRRKLIDQAANVETVKVSDMVVVSQDGSANFTTISEAVSVAPNNTDGSNGYFLIYVKAGIYQEYVLIPKNKKYLMMMGDGINRTIITGNRSVVDGWTTFNSATFAVVASNFVGVNLTIQNTAGPEKHQAVALRNGADLSTFYSCSFEGYQDTLYAHSLRQFYRACDIYGTVDFIFGNAAAVLQECRIYPRLPMAGQFNAITAQGRTDINQNTGISIHNSTITAAPDLATSSTNYSVNTYLGRPWKLYSRTIYMQTFMDDLISLAGWQAWDGDFALSTLYYAEYNNFGPGSNTTSRVTWPGYRIISATDAANFTVSSFLLGDDWLPKTGVPYASSLV